MSCRLPDVGDFHDIVFIYFIIEWFGASSLWVSYLEHYCSFPFFFNIWKYSCHVWHEWHTGSCCASLHFTSSEILAVCGVNNTVWCALEETIWPEIKKRWGSLADLYRDLFYFSTQKHFMHILCLCILCLPRKIWITCLVSKVFSITLLGPFIAVSVSTVGMFTL